MKQILQELTSGRPLSEQEAYDTLIGIIEGKYNETQIAALLMGINMQGATVDELLGFRRALLDTGKPVDLSNYDTIDIVGTGGDNKNTFNISTCSAFVIAGAGYKVSKHGNGSATSVSGASDVLAAHGVRFTDQPDVIYRALDEAGICFFHAPLFAYGMKSVGPTRRALQIPTCFNLLGPLVNPGRPKYNFLGTANLNQMRLYINILQKLGVKYGVVSSYDGYDEISLTGEFKIATNTSEMVLKPSDLKLPTVRPEDIYGGKTKEEAVQIFDNVLNGTATEQQKSVILANAGMAIHSIEQEKTAEECIAIAQESLDSGKALECLRKFIEIYS